MNGKVVTVHGNLYECIEMDFQDCRQCAGSKSLRLCIALPQCTQGRWYNFKLKGPEPPSGN